MASERVQDGQAHADRHLDVRGIRGWREVACGGALREIHRGYVEADRLMGSICITSPIRFQMPVVERACEVTRGADRAEMLRFACQFAEFGGWVFQDAEEVTRYRLDSAGTRLRRQMASRWNPPGLIGSPGGILVADSEPRAAG